ncbi:MAG: NADH-quinone oxidoreductase subunit L, partial [Verrucomicrobia bacterium]|nr:NADH-quinone oxidoreductase subunit L [Verrucomicrobiota bacterium]
MNIFLLIALVPLLPFLAAGITALLKREQRGLSATLVIAAQTISCAISLFLFVGAVSGNEERFFQNFTWLTFGHETLRLGLIIDPLSAG